MLVLIFMSVSVLQKNSCLFSLKLVSDTVTLLEDFSFFCFFLKESKALIFRFKEGGMDFYQ